MKKGKHYLVLKKDSDGIRQWKCKDVSETAYFIEPIISVTSWSLFNIDKQTESFWLLKSNISTVMGTALFTIIEELKD